MSDYESIEEQEKGVIQRLRNEREKQKLSQLELSLKAGISQPMVNYIEKGDRTPTLTTLLKICRALEINPSLLFEHGDVEKKEAKDKIISLLNEYMK